MRTEDGSIIQECLNGKPGAFGVLVDKYKEGVYAYVYTELHSFQDAQDVTQEVFLQAYRDLRSLRQWESFGFWLYRIAHRRCIQWFRVRSRRVDGEFIADQSPEAIDASSLDSYRENQVDESVREALSLLPEVHREVLVLRYFGGMKSNEIAGVLGTSPAAIRKRLSRARAQLREEMVTMMDTAFEERRLPMGFTLRVVEAVKRIKIHPMPRVAGLPWGLSFAVGIIVTVLSLNPHVSITSDMTIPTGSPLPVETKVLKTGEIPVDILDVSQVSLIASKQGDGDGGKPQKVPMLAPQQGKGGKWTQRADMPTSRAFVSTCAMNGKIYAIGGYDGHGMVSTVEEYDPATDTWTEKSDMLTARYVLSTSALNGKIYAIGGGNFNVALSAVEEYDPETDTWARKSDMPIATENVSGSVVNGKIYIIGGIAAKEPISTVQEYDPVTDTWKIKKDMPTPREGLTSVVNGKIYVIGGERALAAEPSAAVEEYDPATDIWTKKSDMPIPRACPAISVMDEKIYVIGGSREKMPWGPDAIVQVYDPAKDEWTTAADTPTARHGLSASVVNGKVYAIGGSITGLPFTPVPTVEEYDPAFVSIEANGKLPTKWGEVKSD